MNLSQKCIIKLRFDIKRRISYFKRVKKFRKETIKYKVTELSSKYERKSRPNIGSLLTNNGANNNLIELMILSTNLTEFNLERVFGLQKEIVR